MERLRRFLMSMTLIFASTLLYAQTEITGSVEDDMGPIIGATVKAGTTLVFSYIGYEKQELPAQQGMKVVMKDNAAQLAEVVVTGYQVQRKADLTGAVAVMDMKGAKSEGDPNMLNSMQGKLPGVNIVNG